MIGPPICNATHATVKVPGAPDREYTRNPQETLAAFKARMVRELPVRYVGQPQSFVSKCESEERRVDAVELLEFSQIYRRPLNYFVE